MSPDGTDGTHRGTGSGAPHTMDAADWDARYAETPLVWSREPNEFVAAECSALAAGTALDLGCGEGRNALWLAGRGWRVTAVDFSPVAVDKATALGSDAGLAVRWVVADLLGDLPDVEVDLVLLAYVHLGVHERQRLVRAAAHRVAPGGSLLLVGHDLRNLDDGIGGPREPSVLWSPAEVDVAGWQVRRRETAARRVGEDRAWDTVVHLVRPVGQAIVEATVEAPVEADGQASPA